MQIKIKVLIYIVTIAFFSLSCEEDQSEMVQFKYQVLNTQGQICTEFNSGDNFVLSFEIINSSDHLINLIGFETEDFFKVYTISQSEGKSEVGKPYSAVFCEYRSSHPISPGNTLRLERLWVTPDSIKSKGYFNNSIICGFQDNELLTEGLYYSAFKSSFEFSTNGESYTLPEQQFEVYFEFN